MENSIYFNVHFYESGLKSISNHTDLTEKQSFEILDDMLENLKSEVNKEIIPLIDRMYEYSKKMYKEGIDKRTCLMYFMSYLVAIGDIFGDASDNSPEYLYAYEQYLNLLTM